MRLVFRVLGEQARDGLRGRRTSRRVVVHVGGNLRQQGLPRAIQIPRQRVGEVDFPSKHLQLHLLGGEQREGNIARQHLDQRGANRVDLP